LPNLLYRAVICQDDLAKIEVRTIQISSAQGANITGTISPWADPTASGLISLESEALSVK